MESTQTWVHYRHMEETRTKYLSFFATVILTSSGFLVTLLKDIEKFDPLHFSVSVSFFLLLLFLFSYFIWANIVRISFVLSAYEIIMSEIRAFMLVRGSTAFNLWNVREKVPQEVSKGIFRISSAASTIVLGICVSLLFGEAYISFLVLTRAILAPMWVGYIMGLFVVVGGILLVNAKVGLSRALKFQPPKQELSQFSLYQGEYEIDTQPFIQADA